MAAVCCLDDTCGSKLLKSVYQLDPCVYQYERGETITYKCRRSTGHEISLEVTWKHDSTFLIKKKSNCRAFTPVTVLRKLIPKGSIAATMEMVNRVCKWLMYVLKDMFSNDSRLKEITKAQATEDYVAKFLYTFQYPCTRSCSIIVKGNTIYLHDNRTVTMIGDITYVV